MSFGQTMQSKGSSIDFCNGESDRDTLGIELAHSRAVALAGVSSPKASVDLSQLNIYKRITTTKCPELKSEY